MARESMMTIRLDRRTRVKLDSAARRRGRTPSAVARAAIEAWLYSDEDAAGAAPYDAVVDLIGCVRGGDPGRSTTGARVIADRLRKGTLSPRPAKRPGRR